TVWVWIRRFGNSSFVLGHLLVQEDQPCVYMEATMVVMDHETGKPKPHDDVFRQEIDRHARPALTRSPIALPTLQRTHPMLETTELIDHADFSRLAPALSDEESALRDKIRDFGINHGRPVINDSWERAEFPYETLPELKKLGIVGSFVQGYGAPGFSRREAGLLSRELGRIDGSFCTFLGVHANLSMGSIYLLGNEEQRQRWLPAMAALDKTGAFALTEPTH